MPRALRNRGRARASRTRGGRGPAAPAKPDRAKEGLRGDGIAQKRSAAFLPPRHAFSAPRPRLRRWLTSARPGGRRSPRKQPSPGSASSKQLLRRLLLGRDRGVAAATDSPCGDSQKNPPVSRKPAERGLFPPGGGVPTGAPPARAPRGLHVPHTGQLWAPRGGSCRCPTGGSLGHPRQGSWRDALHQGSCRCPTGGRCGCPKGAVADAPGGAAGGMPCTKAVCSYPTRGSSGHPEGQLQMPQAGQPAGCAAPGRSAVTPGGGLRMPPGRLRHPRPALRSPRGSRLPAPPAQRRGRAGRGAAAAAAAAGRGRGGAGAGGRAGPPQPREAREDGAPRPAPAAPPPRRPPGGRALTRRGGGGGGGGGGAGAARAAGAHGEQQAGPHHPGCLRGRRTRAAGAGRPGDAQGQRLPRPHGQADGGAVRAVPLDRRPLLPGEDQAGERLQAELPGDLRGQLQVLGALEGHPACRRPRRGAQVQHLPGEDVGAPQRDPHLREMRARLPPAVPRPRGQRRRGPAGDAVVLPPLHLRPGRAEGGCPEEGSHRQDAASRQDGAVLRPRAARVGLAAPHQPAAVLLLLRGPRRVVPEDAAVLPLPAVVPRSLHPVPQRPHDVRGPVLRVFLLRVQPGARVHQAPAPALGRRCAPGALQPGRAEQEEVLRLRGNLGLCQPPLGSFAAREADGHPGLRARPAPPQRAEQLQEQVSVR
ncbi:PHD finger protein 19 isoform X1 [Dromaius novaehollandiae]|uniref:PHD finger protein 19 isoform X1 n=1 Tax=Dromaius novaehollandiae TaxID=8790 RepID=UPI00311DF926